MVKSRSSSPVRPYTIISLDYPLLTYDEARALPLPPTPPELIHDDSPSSHDYTPRVPANDPTLLAALAKLRLMSAFRDESTEDVDR